MTFVVIGDTNADIRGSLDAFPKEGDDTTVRDSSWHAGGSGANVAVALAKLGAKVRLVSRVGVDPAAEIALEAARKAGVDLTHVQRDESTPTGLCFAAISPNGERTLFGFRGANPLLEAVDPSVLDGAKWLHISGHALLDSPQAESTLLLMAEATRRRVLVSLDLCMPLARRERSQGVVRTISRDLRIIFGNQEEHELLGDREMDCHYLVAKLGAAGSRFNGISSPGFPVEARDTTACGDAFIAGFLFIRAPIPTALTVGNAVGALTATRPGAAESTPTLAELSAFLDAQHTHMALDALFFLQRPL